MAGHVDTSQIMLADLDTTWRITNDLAHLSAGHSDTKFVSADPGRRAVTLRIVVVPPNGGKVWEYLVERIRDPDRKIVYAHRWGNSNFEYSHAVWHYSTLADGQTRLRCVQDFEVSALSEVSDSEMERIIGNTTAGMLLRTARLIESSGIRSHE